MTKCSTSHDGSCVIHVLHLLQFLLFYSAGLWLQPHTWCFGKTLRQALSLVWSIFHTADPAAAGHSVSVCSARGVRGTTSPGGQVAVPLESQTHGIGWSFRYRNKLWADFHITGKWYIFTLFSRFCGIKCHFKQ